MSGNYRKGIIMSMKLKILGLGLLAVMATSAFAVMNAGATTGGHFVSSVSHTIIKGTETPVIGVHVQEFAEEGSTSAEAGIYCTESSYEGTANAATVTELTITPNWDKCHTTTKTENFTVTENGCDFNFTVRPEGHTKHNTVHLLCPVGKAIEIHHPNCTITVPAQTVEGVVYTRQPASGNPDWITLDSTVKGIESQYHGGICIFLGTSHKSVMVGSVTVEGFNTAGEKVSITAT